ncbi:hypothetical protein Barb6XT_01875 [Bacteroidales bacterium Barb6XT]|nr:hypothetical protein Barb6XT_01875 [Bacteroidales bacterium Barb6XT]
MVKIMRDGKGYRRFMATALLAIFTSYYVNVGFFYHCHVINGVTIVHSHIHDSGHTKADGHSPSELTLISSLSSLQALMPALIVAATAVFALLLVFERKGFSRKADHPYLNYVFLRAPPALS